VLHERVALVDDPPELRDGVRGVVAARGAEHRVLRMVRRPGLDQLKWPAFRRCPQRYRQALERPGVGGVDQGELEQGLLVLDVAVQDGVTQPEVPAHVSEQGAPVALLDEHPARGAGDMLQPVWRGLPGHTAIITNSFCYFQPLYSERVLGDCDRSPMTSRLSSRWMCG
jgi:hypothetical protein